MKNFIVNVLFMFSIIITILGFGALVIIGLRFIFRLIFGKTIISILKQFIIAALVTAIGTTTSHVLSENYDTLL
jgi:hypothetical protein